MTQTTHALVLDLDLERDEHDAVCAFLAAAEVLPDKWTGIRDIADIPTDIRTKPCTVFVLFARQETPNQERLSRALAMIGRAETELEHSQLLQKVASIRLIDCGMEPCAPISNHFVLASYLESLAERVGANANGAILAVTYDDEMDPGSMQLHDTREPAFFEQVVKHTRQTLTRLNTNMGQGDLPEIGGSN